VIWTNCSVAVLQVGEKKDQRQLGVGKEKLKENKIYKKSCERMRTQLL